jgi:hypothetical protein
LTSKKHLLYDKNKERNIMESVNTYPIEKLTVPETLSEVLQWGDASCHEQKVAIRKNYLKGAESFLIVGCLLSKIHASGEWKNDGSEATNWNTWVEKEMNVKRSNSNRMMRVWKCIESLLPHEGDLVLSVDFSKMVSLIPVMKDLKNAEKIEWLHHAQVLTCEALGNQVRQYTGKMPTDVCDHKHTEAWERCIDCGDFLRVRK